MAHASRNLRQKRRIKRTNTLLARAVRTEQSQRYTTHAILCALLVQHGGEAGITASTLQHVHANMARLSFRVEPVQDDPSYFVVRLIEAPRASEIRTTDSIPSGVPAVEIVPPEARANQSRETAITATHEQCEVGGNLRLNGELYGDD